MPDQPDGRHFFRYPVTLPFQHRGWPPFSARTGVGWTRDISEGGVRVELPEHLQVMQPIQLRLRTNRGAIELEASVVWKEKDRPARREGASPLVGCGILHGMVFSRGAPDQLQALRALLRSLAGTEHPRVRLPLDTPALCQPQEEGSRPVRGWAGDISRGGLLLRLPDTLSLGTPVEIRLDTPNAPITAEGVVVWTEHSEPRSDLIRHGVRFTAIGWYALLSLGLLLTVS